MVAKNKSLSAKSSNLPQDGTMWVTVSISSNENINGDGERSIDPRGGDSSAQHHLFEMDACEDLNKADITYFIESKLRHLNLNDV
jgi:hypothetical protein